MTNNLKDILKERGITQKDFATQMNVSEITMSKYVNALELPDNAEADICRLLGVTPSDLYSTAEKSKLPKALYEGLLHFADKSLSCAVLDNGLRIITAKAVFDAFDRPRKGKSNENYRADLMPSFINANNLQPFVDEQLIGWTRLEDYIDSGGNIRQGYNARIIRGLCKVYMDARNANALLPSQERFAKISETILYALSDVGIVALVDEATGYDKVKSRAKDELQKILSKFLLEEAGKWVKTFNDQFFEDLYKMHKWNWEKTAKRPGVVGIWINDIVYQRIAPAIYEELRKRNPKNESGNRKWKHHQFFTDDVGKTKLLQHLEALHALATISDFNWARFMAYVDKTYPKKYQQLSIIFEEETDE